ncbi:MAG: LppX_LprAFG lipoprotein [Acidimicrobiales bacterium]
MDRTRFAERRRFAIAAVVILVALLGCSSGSGQADDSSAQLSTDPVTLQTTASSAMGGVTSVRFSLDRSGDPVFIDQAKAISLTSLQGRFAAPASADAVLAVEVSGLLNTEIGAVAIDEEIWLSNPLTGEFETLPPGFDIDPSSFFDPKGAWEPLLRDLRNVEFVGEEDRDGQTLYHLRGLAPADRMQAVTAGLVRGSDIQIDLWLDPKTALVSTLEFEAELGEGNSSWVLGFSDYGEPFTITDPTVEE